MAKPKKKKDVTEHYVPGEPKDRWLPERIRILKERRLLRKDLKLKGITARADFEAVAESLGLVLWKDTPLLAWWHYAWKGLLGNLGLGTLLASAAALLTALFLMSYVTEQKGSFTINLTAEMLKAGFVLYETAEFQHPETRIFSERMEQVNNITLSDISADVDHIDGPHNGKNYVAHTFYIRNEGEQSADYAWYVKLLSQTMNVDKAVWLMLFEDGRQLIYAQKAPGGEAEELYGFREAPFADAAYSQSQYYQKDGRWGITTTPYAEAGIVAQGVIRDVSPGEAHKYTVVIWVEGHDPECTDAIFGGYAKYAIDFENVSHEEDDNIFSGLFRREYSEYGMNPEG